MGILLGLWKFRAVAVYVALAGALLCVWAERETIRADRATCNAQIAANANALNQAATAATNELQRRLDAAETGLVQADTTDQRATALLRAKLAAEAVAPGGSAAPLPVLQDALAGIAAAHGGQSK
jgi:porphobilinogen deaminase